MKKLTSIIAAIAMTLCVFTVFTVAEDTSLTATAYMVNAEGAVYVAFNKTISSYDGVAVYAQTNDGAEYANTKIGTVEKVSDNVLKFTAPESVGNGTLDYWNSWLGLKLYIAGTPTADDGSVLPLGSYNIRNGDTGWQYSPIQALEMSRSFADSGDAVIADNVIVPENTDPVYDLVARAYAVNDEGAVYLVFNKALTHYAAAVVWAESADGGNRIDTKLGSVTKINDNVLKFTGSAVGAGTLGYWRDWMGPLTIHVQNTVYAGSSELPLEDHNIRNGDTGWAYTAIKAYTPELEFVDAGKVPTVVYTEDQNVVDATCTEPGSKEAVTFCKTEEEGATPVELSRETVSIDAKGHTPGEPETVVEENENETVTKEIVKCTECGETVSETVVSTVPKEKILTAKALLNNSDGTLYIVFDKALDSFTGITVWAETADGSERVNTKFENVTKLTDKILKCTSSGAGENTFDYWNTWMSPLEIYVENTPSAKDGSKLALSAHSIRNGDTGWQYKAVSAAKLEWEFIGSEDEAREYNINSVKNLIAEAYGVDSEGAVYLVFNRKITSYKGLTLWVESQDNAERFDQKLETVEQISPYVLKFSGFGEGTLNYLSTWSAPLTVHLEGSPKAGNSELPLESHNIRNAETGWNYTSVRAYTPEFSMVESADEIPSSLTGSRTVYAVSCAAVAALMVFATGVIRKKEDN
ncbi:MAG: hypothetical protein IKS28_05865 [Clostridia bacterium]|nr:hypothetical protein [Clostridia bacterium]